MIRLRKLLAAIEPWYDFGRREVSRMDMHCRDFADESWADVYFIELQWFGLHLAFEIGRTPRKITEAEIAAYRATKLRKKER